MWQDLVCAWEKCGPADWRTGKLQTQLADWFRILPMCIASCNRPLAQGQTNCLVALRALEFTLFMGPPSLHCLPSLLPLPLSPLYIPSPTLTSEVGPLNAARGLGEHCKWGVGRSHSVNQIRCILPFKSEYLLAPIYESNISYESQPHCLLSEGTTGEGYKLQHSRHSITAVGLQWQWLGGALVFIRRHIIIKQLSNSK